MKRKIISAVSLVLIFLVVCSLIFGIAASAAVNENAYDFSKEGSSYNKTFNSADILEDYLGEETASYEREYLVTYGGINVGYDDGITTANVNAFIENGKLNVNAYEYIYIAQNGTQVIWIPDTVTLGNIVNSFSHTSSGYYTEFLNVDEEYPYHSIKVEYVLKIKIAREDINRLLNKAKNDIPALEREIEEKKAEYEQNLAAYNLQLSAYKKYLIDKEAYDNNLAVYKQYLIEYRLYKESLDAYNEYLADLKEYEIAKAAREEYEAALIKYKADYALYVDYLVAKKAYEDGLAEYEKYTSQLRKFRNCLQIINYTEKTMTHLERSLRGAVYGTVVDTVLKEREKLESNLVGAPPKVIDLAGEATEMLRSLLNDYFSFTTEQSRYNYYLEHYEQFKTGFIDLFISLDYLYSIPSVSAVLYETKKDEKYRILLAQLYVVALAISDEPVQSVSADLVAGSKGADRYKQFTYDANYTIDIYEYTVEGILGKDNILTDTNSATPINEPFPTEVTCPSEPSAVSEPKEPEYIAPPNDVTVVDEPLDKPDEVFDPGEEPVVVLDPLDPPTEYIPPVQYLNLIAEKDSLTERFNFISDDFTICLRKTITKKFIDPDEVNVKFYSHIGGELLYETVVDSGTAASFSGVVPAKKEDASATYSFAGWQNSNGALVDLNCVESDLILYPSFITHIKSYKVIFDVEGKRTEKLFEYGSVPVYDLGIPHKDDTEYCYFTFAGWDKPLSAVTDDQTYTAIFNSHYILPTSGSGASVTFDGENLVVDFGACYDRSFLLTNVLDRALKLGGITVITPYCRILLTYSNVKELCSLGAYSMSVDITETTGDIYTYLLKITDENGAPLKKSVPIKIYDPTVSFVNNSRLKLYTIGSDGVRKYSKFSLTDEGLTFNAHSHETYNLSYEYRLIPLANNVATLTTDREVYTSGESVLMSLTVPDGYVLTRLYYLDKEGKKVDLKVLRFTMPDFDITMVAEVTPIKHKITFVSNDIVISSAYYSHGAVPTPPESPKKMSDENYDYTFAGWSEEIGPAYGDAVYYAVFSATPRLPAPEEIPEPGFWEIIGNFFANIFKAIADFFKNLFNP